MHAVRSLINQQRDWSIASGFGHMLDHLLHDQRIADDKALSFRSGKTTFAQYCTDVQLHEEHQTQLADTSVHQALELGISGCLVGGLAKFPHVRSTNRVFYCGNYRFERPGRDYS